MKRLNKKQILFISLISITTILVVFVCSYLTHNIITQSIPAMRVYEQNLGHKSPALREALFLNIFFQLVLIFVYALFLWLAIKQLKTTFYKGVTTSPEEEPPTNV